MGLPWLRFHLQGGRHFARRAADVTLGKTARQRGGRPLRTASPLIFLAAAGAFVCALPGCDQQADRANGPPAAAVVSQDRPGLMFRYLEGAGGLAPATAIAEVPESARAEVVVVDSQVSPEERGAAGWVHVADLRQPDDEGRYPVKVLARSAFEARLRTRAAAAGPKVTMYSTTWCGVCKKARSFLAKQGVKYVEKDIEKDPGASAELQAKAAKAGVKANGVPVFDVGGTLINGFDEGKLRKLL
jgi:glutaredoxin